jgi:hypothetical protein
MPGKRKGLIGRGEFWKETQKKGTYLCEPIPHISFVPAQCDFCGKEMGHNVTKLRRGAREGLTTSRSDHTRGCTQAPAEVRRSCGYEGAAAGALPPPAPGGGAPVPASPAPAPVPAPAQRLADVSPAPATRVAEPSPWHLSAPKRPRTQPQMTSMFPARQVWNAPTEQELASACAEAAAEAGIAFNAFSLPSVKRLLCVASGGKLAESEVPTPYKIVKALAPIAERRTAEQVTGWTKLARDFTLSACLDGWQSRRGIEMITSAVGGPGAETPHFIGFATIRGKVSWDRVKQMHELSVSELVSPKSVGLIVHDEGSKYTQGGRVARKG